MRNRTEVKVKLVFIRHGMTAGNSEHRYIGTTDEPLTKEGIIQLGKIKYPKVDLVFTSPLLRCRQTAGVIYSEIAYRTVQGFQEMDFGAFEGKNYKELSNDSRYQAWIDSNGTLPFPEGESKEAFVARCQDSLLHLLSESEVAQKTIALIVHGGTIMALLSSFHGGEYYSYQVANGEGFSCTAVLNEEGLHFSELQKI